MGQVRLTLGEAIRWIVQLAAIVAFLAILVAMLLTITDIVLRLASRVTVPFTGYRQTWAVSGVVDISQLLVMVAASLAIPFAFLKRAHVAVDLFDVMLPKSVRQFTAMISGVLSLLVLSACFYYGYREMLQQVEMNTMSSTIGIPYIAYWVPLLTGFLLSVLAIIGNVIAPGPKQTDDGPSDGGSGAHV